MQGENYKNGLSEIKSEGTKVSKGENVFMYYGSNEKNLKEKIEELDVEIGKALENQTETYSADIQLIDKQIDTYLSKMLSTNKNHDIEEYKSNISEALIKKAKIAGELSPSGSYINKLIEQRRKYEEELNNSQEYVKAETSGIVSYRVDGLEDELKPDNFVNMNKKVLEEYNLKTGQMISTSLEAGKIVNNFECYIVTFLDSEEAQSATVGSSITLRLSDGREIDADIESIVLQESGEVMIVFRTNKAVEDLIAYRKISIDVIWWSYTGLKVPNSAIIEEGGLNYVVRNRTGYNDKIIVNVLKQNKNYSIITNYTADELRELGYDNEEIYSRKLIGLYDEILAYPKK